MGFEGTKVPDSFGEADDYPKTVRGKIEYMVDIGKGLLEKSDQLIKLSKALEARRRIESMQTGHSTSTTDQVWLEILSQFALKLATLTALQTECIEQLYWELRKPE